MYKPKKRTLISLVRKGMRFATRQPRRQYIPINRLTPVMDWLNTNRRKRYSNATYYGQPKRTRYY